MEQPLSAIGTPPSSKPVYDALFRFINDALPQFEPFSLDSKGIIVKAEDDITEDLSVFLDYEQEKKSGQFKFVNQSKKSDIGVKYGRGYTSYNRSNICWIEAKRLPTPDLNIRDEKEYVVIDKKKKGKGGIERFKENKHGPNLPYSIMIGYIQDYSFDYWLQKINTWIKDISEQDLFWSKGEVLKPYTYTTPLNGRFISIHSRRSKKQVLQNIELRHFWISLQ